MSGNVIIGIILIILCIGLAILSKAGILGDGWLDKAEKIASVVALVLALIAFINPFPQSSPPPPVENQQITIGDNSSGNIVAQSKEGDVLIGDSTISSTLIFNAPVGSVVTAETIEELTIYSGDSPEVKQRKAKQRAKLIASNILYYITNTDARLGLVETTLGEDDFGLKLDEVRSTVAPAAQEIFASAYQELITTEKINSLRQQFNSYPLATKPSPLLLELVADSEVNPSDVQFFYNQLGEIQWASETLLDDLLIITKQDSNNKDWIAYYQKRLRLSVDTLENRSELAHIAGLNIFNDLPVAYSDSDATIKLASLTHLQPHRIVDDTEATTLLTELLKESEVLSKQRAGLVEEGQNLLEQDLDEYREINKELIINPTDTWDVVVAKAISLRQFGRIDEAVDAFTKYEDFFTKTDSTAEQYAHTARQFTRQIDSLGVVDGAVYIFDVMAGSVAAKGGLAIGDILIEFNGQKVRNTNDAEAVLQNMPIGEPIEIVFLRLDKQNVFHSQKITVIAQSSLGIGLMPI